MKFIQLKTRKFFVHDCGQCPFFAYDNVRGEYNKCKAYEGTMYVSILGIPKSCPLPDDPDIVRNDLENECKNFYDHEYGSQRCESFKVI
jgi:hypothetical protein